MKTSTILYAALALEAGVLGCQNENAAPRREQPVAGFAGGKDLPTAANDPAPSPSIIGVNTMHADDGRLAKMVIGILATDGFDQEELVEPRQAFASEGATTIILSTRTGTIQGYHDDTKGDMVKVDTSIVDVTTRAFDALLLPGGILNGERMRLDPGVTSFVRSFVQSGKPIAAICYGLWPLVEVDVVRGRTLTSCPSLRTDLKNAGAKWVDQDVVEDRNLVTSRGPDDIPAFNAKAMSLFAKRRSAQPPAIGGGPASTQ